MSVTSQTDKEASDVEPRTRRALEEIMAVLPEDGEGLARVYSESGNEYIVDPHDGACTCPDIRHNLGHDENCKHIRRARFALGIDAIQAEVLEEVRVHENLGRYTDADLRFATADGGVVGKTEKLDGFVDDGEDKGSGECDECAELPDDDLPCFECYMETQGYIVNVGGGD